MNRAGGSEFLDIIVATHMSEDAHPAEVLKIITDTLVLGDKESIADLVSAETFSVLGVENRTMMSKTCSAIRVSIGPG